MAFYINYCENGIEKRLIMEVNDERMQDEGEKLGVENNAEDTSEIIWNQLEVVIGKRFWDIEPDEKATRYLFVHENITNTEPEIITNAVVEPKNDRVQNIYNDPIRIKKWWEFWK